ncbi:T9SS type A sorting domain-containing protein [Flavobacterium sp.]|uniref:T9SS type A sorting domain-containing protein n=1 Tax=Flavobacterium sp. TaxID=239 RepID=UPI0026026404|nr:T9SS type A sorting domain-containing protein [Flavobacterium sp.]
MIKKILFTFLLLSAVNSIAQIGSFPASETFDMAFTEGTDIEFIPNWTGNLVNPPATATRIFRDETVYFSAPAALSIIPTSSFTGDVRVSLDMTSATSLAFSFKAKSMLNGDGTGTRNVILIMETSLDAGATWIGTQQVASLPNADQADFADYSYALPAAANNQSGVLVRFKVTRGDGSGTAGKLVIDDVSIAQSSAPQLAVDETSMTFSQILGTPSPTHTVNVSGSNLTGNIILNISEGFEMSETENGTYGAVIALNETDGVVAETIIYVRMNVLTAGDYTGTLTISTPGVADAAVALSGSASNISVTNPEPIQIYGGMAPIFTAWDPASAMNTFPANMAFWTHGITDPDLNVQFTEDWHCLYNLTNRSRFFGEGDNGVSFVNTGNSQYTGVCDGSDPTQASGAVIDNGRAGAVVLAISTLGTIGGLDMPLAISADLNWTARTILKNNRVYGIRMQYRLGNGNGNPNTGWTEFPTVQDYISGEDNTFQTFVTPLPAECFYQEVVQIRWVYYYISGTGSRAQLAVDDIGFTNVQLSTDDIQKTNRFSFYPNPANGNMIHFNVASDIIISDISGKQVMKADNVTDMNISTLSKGIYFIRNNEGQVLKMIR